MNIQTQNFIIDACRQNHILIAGTTGSGKSVLLKSILCYIVSQNYAADIIDLKRVSLIEFRPLYTGKKSGGIYADDVEAAAAVFDKAVNIMSMRYNKMLKMGIDKTTEQPYYIIIDEAADLLDSAPELKQIIIHLLRLGRAANVRLIFATQAPDRKTIPAAVQQNTSTVFALRCRSAVESRQIIGVSGAERLQGAGTALYYTDKMNAPQLIKINMLSADDIKSIVNYRLQFRPRKSIFRRHKSH